MMAGMIGAAALLLGSVPVQQAPAASCPVPTSAAAGPVTAATDGATAPTIAVGASARVSLAEVAGIRFAMTPGHAPAAGTRGGLVAVMISAPGRYRIGLGGPAWIDMVRGTTALPSVAHAHGDACSPLKKLVDFDLVPGRYLVQLSGTAASDLLVAVTRQP